MTESAVKAAVPPAGDPAGLRAAALARDAAFAADIAAIYRNTIVAWPFPFLLFSALAVIFWNDVNPLNALWPLGIHAVAKWSLLSAHREWTQDAERNANAKYWALRSLAPALLMSLSWAAMAAVFFIPGDFAAQAFISLVIMGVASGTMIERACYVPSLVTAIAAPLLTMILLLASEGGHFQVATAAFAAVYLVLLLGWANRIAAEARMRSHLEHDNVSLADALKREQESANAARVAAEAARDAAEAGNRTKSEFLATVSHEIRTPLNGILGMANLLAEGALSPQQRSAVSDIRDAADGLCLILNDILDLSKLEAGKFSLEPAPMSPKRVAEAVARMFQARAWEKNLDIEVAIDERAPASIRADAGRLRQVLMNLVGNAIKFTDKGGVAISVEPASDNAQRPMLRFAVTDTGIGIPKEAFNRLFQNFSQVDQSHARRFNGTGLGLAISRKLVALMGGEIGVTSELGVGSTFWFMVPADVVSEDRPMPAPAPAAELSPSRRLHILAVDDNAINRRLLANTLAAMGHGVVTANDGLQAYEEVQRQNFDVILMDLHMPGVDGTQATRMIRNLAGPAAHTPIIALTAHNRERVREGRLAEGMQGVVTKPFAVRDLMTAIAQALSQDTAEAAGAGGDQESVIDVNAIEELERSLGRESLKEVLQSYLETAGDLTRRIEEAAKAGDNP
ncbi:MAG TPA: ATP-binding protein, partial [Micropepsaceae bacterium]|nr:ATP-binding protein [Micropepsaceae bacterium]